MNFNRYFILSIALVLLAFSSCKKDTEKTYMDGTLKVDCEFPFYVTPGDKFTMTASGITAPDGTDVAYYFSSSASDNRRDTVRTVPAVYQYEVPDTLGTFSMSIVAFAVESSDKYYVSSASFEFVTVKDGGENGSVRGVVEREDDQTESLYSRNYLVTSAGGKEWIRSNLCYVERNSSGEEIFGRSFAGSPAMQNIFGAYYTWEEAVKACPAGWHLPTDAEWVALLKASGAPDTLQPLESSPCGAGSLMARATFNGEELWSYYRGVNITDKSISALPFGYAIKEARGWTYIGYQSYAAFWTADEFDGQGVYRYIYKENDNVFVGSADKQSFAASVRCVR